MLDILVRGAKVIDGTGSPWFRADVGVKDGRIAAIGLVPERARTTLRARGATLCPGFVDAHTHAEKGLLVRPSADSALRQGITTVVGGNCGGSAYPIRKSLAALLECRAAINIAMLVGHGTLRQQVMGRANRRPNRSELTKMRRLAERAMREGAVGLSTGLFYPPGAYADTREVIEISKAVAAYGGVYATHMRCEKKNVLTSLSEAATIGRQAGISVQVSHMKVFHRRGVTRPNRAAEALALLERFRAHGLDVTYDVYPYTATSTTLAAVAIPAAEARDGKLVERLRSARVRRRIRKRVSDAITWAGGAKGIVIAEFQAQPKLQGKSLAEIAASRRRAAVDVAMDLVVEGATTSIFHALRQKDVDAFVTGPCAMIGSDGLIAVSRDHPVHPRCYGAFPRAIRQYVREKNLLNLHEMIRRMTSMPARKFGLSDRGLIAVGMAADMVLFDPDTIADTATFERPHSYPVGIRKVLVNGRIAFDGTSVTKIRAGKPLRRL